MTKRTLITLCSVLVAVTSGFSQDVDAIISGTVLNDANDNPLERVHIVNLNQVKGAVSTGDGSFSVPARVNDTLYFSHLGFRSIRVRVTSDWFEYGNITVKMTEVGIALEEVELKPVQLTGYIQVDTKIIPVYEDHRYSISGLPIAYEGGGKRSGGVSRTLRSLSNPADLLYNMFGKRPNKMRKLRQAKADDHIRNLMQTKFDRETLLAMLQIEKEDLDEMLNICDYSREFVRSANDLQLLDAINECYEEYRVLGRGRD